MPTLQIATALEITDAEAALLCDVLRCKPDQLQDQIGRYSVAAIREYLDMFMGAAAVTTATDVRERRLVGLLLTAFRNELPDDQHIARIFNLTPTAARSLLRSVVAKHRLRVKEPIDLALKGVLDACQRDKPDTPYSVVILNPILVELLNARLATSPQPKARIRSSGDSLTKYTVDQGSYDYLRGIL